MNLLDGTTNQTLIYRTRSWVEIDDTTKSESYNTPDQIKYITTMIRSSLFGFSDTQMFGEKTITITGAGADAAARQPDERNEKEIFKHHASNANSIIEKK